MKRNYILSLIFASVSIGAYSQGAMDAFNLSYNDLGGTARSVSMGGAFGALGGDATGVSINPAGIGVYKSSEFVATLNFSNTETKTNLNGFKSDDSKFKFIFDNIAFIGAIPLNSDVVPLLNVGFSYNRLKSFNRNISSKGNNLDHSLTDNIADRANSQGSGYDKITTNGKYNNGADWLGTLGYQSYLIDPDKNGVFHSAVPNSNTNNSLLMREKGEISSYDFNIGTTISDMLSIGVTVAVTDINYKLDSDYYEQFVSNSADYYLTNWLETEGSGWQLKAGLILKPIEELRIGVSYHSPTWYKMTDYFWADMDAFGNGIVYTPDEAHDYEFRTPDKWTFSLAGVIAKRAIISADYELTNYGSMHLADYNGNAYTTVNNDIEQAFRNSSTLRLGAEIRFTPQFSGRVGYMWQQTPVKESFKNSNADIDNPNALKAQTAGTIPQYSLVGDANYFTWGLGYKFTPSLYTDVAFVIKNRTDDLYDYAGADKTELKTNQFTGLLTLGYKF